MTYYTLSNVANQSFYTTLNGHTFFFTFHTFRGLTYIDVSVDETLAQAGVIAHPNESLFKEEVNEAAGGIFLFFCTGDDYPHYSAFNDTTERFAFKPYGE